MNSTANSAANEMNIIGVNPSKIIKTAKPILYPILF